MSRIAVSMYNPKLMDTNLERSGKALSVHKRRSWADPSRQKPTHHVRLSPEAVFYLQCVAAHDKKTQGELIEQWAQAAYAWRCFSGKIITITKPMKTSVRRILIKNLDLKEMRLDDMVNKYDRLPFYSKPYYCIRRTWESLRISVAIAALFLKSKLVRLLRREKLH